MKKPSRRQRIWGGMCFRNRNGLTIIDTLITLCIIGILFGVVVPKYERVLQQTRKAAVKAELGNIRASINLFKLLNGRNPTNLVEMIEKKVLLPGRIGTDEYSKSFYDQKYLNAHTVDSKGNVLDAFGNPIVYDPVRGEVKSSTKGYENW